MKARVRWIALIFALGLFIPISACGRTDTVDIPATGDIVIEHYDLSGFDQVEVAGFFKAEVTQGKEFKVLVEAERALFPYLVVRVRGGRLQVGLKPGIIFNFEEASQRVELTLPALSRASIGNHCTMQLVGLSAEETLQLEAADFSTLRGSIEARKVQVDVSNHSSLVLTGSASQVTGKVSDFGSADLADLDATDVDIEADGKSTLKR
jgi:hypothetical protein